MKHRAPVQIWTDRQLFVDNFWIDKSSGIRRILKTPEPQNIALDADRAWDYASITAGSFIKDGDLFRAWYRCDHDSAKRKTRSGADTAYAESKDGITWTKPNLRLFEIDGSRDNNIVWMGPGTNIMPFKDSNPETSRDQLYKAIGKNGNNLFSYASPDGISWYMLQQNPLSTDGPFDSPNLAFWDESQGQYVGYTRGVANNNPNKDSDLVKHQIGKEFKGGVRWIRRMTSTDFLNWTPLENIDCGDTPFEHLYTNACTTYDRAPGIYLIFSARFIPHRTADPTWPDPGLRDIVFMSSRDGINFDRSFMESFIRPGIDFNNWHERGIGMERGILHTKHGEISLFGMENKGLPTQRIRRYTLRTDGFVSVNAGYDEGTFSTPPFIFSGKTLEVNYSTSAVGSLKLEIQDSESTPLQYFTLEDCQEMFGDEIGGLVQWRSNPDLSTLAGKPVRLHFRLKDADLFAFKFNS